ncbi:hypothetical protein P9D28_05025 [Bacillus haynesii]|uniref:hypothetical protein n=1 Tax=Bacillus haynesii TaxID=1925021 RepID=UPI002DB58C38|nr:hypothetical protein [Bacillus haynesii]MEC1457861.1 hypothetical protein [Bacillus haynesii]MEC1551788.1 hypothetical protein [Bacillus haynesii]
MKSKLLLTAAASVAGLSLASAVLMTQTDGMKVAERNVTSAPVQVAERNVTSVKTSPIHIGERNVT